MSAGLPYCDSNSSFAYASLKIYALLCNTKTTSGSVIFLLLKNR